MSINLITKSELTEILMGVEHQTFISLISVTEPSLKAKDSNKNPNPFMLGEKLADGFDLVKVNKACGTVDFEFDRLVRNRNKSAIIAERLAEGLSPLTAEELDAQADARHRKGNTWYRYLTKADGQRSCVAVHKDHPSKVYLGFVYRSKGVAEYRHLNGDTVPSEAVAPFAKIASGYQNQGLSEGDEVVVVVFALDSIIEIAINGRRYRLLDTLSEMSQNLRQNVWDLAEDYLHGHRRTNNVN